MQLCIFGSSTWVISTDNIPARVTYVFYVIFAPYFYYEVYDYGSNDRHYGRCFIDAKINCASTAETSKLIPIFTTDCLNVFLAFLMLVTSYA